MKIVLNPDKELVNEVNKQLQKNKEKFGKMYCPCALERTPDTICICKDFLNNPKVLENYAVNTCIM